VGVRPPAELQEAEEVEEVADLPQGTADLSEGFDEGPRQWKRPRPKERRRRKKNTEGLDKVNIGLLLHYLRLVLIFLALIAWGLLSPVVAMFGPSEHGGPAVLLGLLLFLASLMVAFLAPLLGIVGSVLCVFVPSEAKARGFIITSLVLDVTAVPISIVVQFVVMVGVQSGAGIIGGAMPAFVMGLASWALFMIFLRQVATYVDEQAGADESSLILIQGLFLLFFSPVVFFLGLMLAAVLPCIGALIFLGIVVYAIYLYLMFLKRQLDLIGTLRQVIYSRY
jgi:hypothetical protein